MSIIVDVPSELESELCTEASQLNLPLSEYILRVLLMRQGVANLPKNGAELVAYWQSEGVINSKTDIIDSQEYARKLRDEVYMSFMRKQQSMIIQWSDEDKLFLVTIPEFADRVVMPCTYGKTREEAIRNGEEAIEMYLEGWQVEGEPIPEPNTLQAV